MSSGRRNKLVGQVAEHLVVAELGRLELIATGFAGNVPTFDVIAADEYCRAIPIQVKASSGDSWPSDARNFLELAYDPKTQQQTYRGPVKLRTPDLIFVYVALAQRKKGIPDRFFILTMKELQQVCIKCYCDWMETKNWRRPRKPESYNLRFWIRDVTQYENRWPLIQDRLKDQTPDPSLSGR